MFDKGGIRGPEYGQLICFGAHVALFFRIVFTHKKVISPSSGLGGSFSASVPDVKLREPLHDTRAVVSIPFCASASLALLNESAIGACSNYLASQKVSGTSRSYLWEIDAERVHIQAVQETSKTLAEPRQALVHQLQMHEVGLKIGHGVCQLRELRLQRIDGGLVVSCIADAMAVSVGFSERRT